MKKTIVFATEIPSLLNLDAYHTQQQTLQSIYKRSYNETKPIYQKIKIGCNTPETRIELKSVNHELESESTKTFQRELNKEIIISGRCRVNEKAILMAKNRKRLYGGLFADESCLAQVYLWLVNDAEKVVLFVENDIVTKEKSTTIVRSNETNCNEVDWKQYVKDLIKEYIITKSITRTEIPSDLPIASFGNLAIADKKDSKNIPLYTILV